MRLCNHPKRIFICSRYAGDIERNTKIAKGLCRSLIQAGHAPFAPHLFFPQLLDEQDAAQREQGITLGLAFMEACDEVWVYTGEGLSKGMQCEMEYAQEIGKKVSFFDEVECCCKT